MIPTSGGEVPILEVEGLQAPNMGHDLDDPDKSEKCEHVVRVDWIRTHPRTDFYWEPGFFANQNIAARFRDANTLRRLEEHFDVAEDET